ncbi:uncharacterized protein BCR38DRAFT_351834 [Pseudomassariella vexata]|uniref:Nephrocystin 3-like N-terminal domain-containing protein n=1 Tax=Pseudomassariella vexata TaxID=1141098 RepID=A0A1Y2DJ62_9PEZI|nr:uncharacterized protein BCR38DRAFT_351834 [Pseudomassariella vexata]ORY59252.1 hypothetical protein BCR38DRAFT_351834 [Pseudomassariella vexata]
MIVESLRFSHIEERQSTIPEAHKNTSKWILEGNKASSNQWLVNAEKSIYWIASKEGSGKYSLMKSIHDHINFKSGVRFWVRGRRLVSANRFFWNAGTVMQQS